MKIGWRIPGKVVFLFRILMKTRKHIFSSFPFSIRNQWLERKLYQFKCDEVKQSRLMKILRWGKRILLISKFHRVFLDWPEVLFRCDWNHFRSINWFNAAMNEQRNGREKISKKNNQDINARCVTRQKVLCTDENCKLIAFPVSLHLNVWSHSELKLKFK